MDSGDSLFEGLERGDFGIDAFAGVILQLRIVLVIADLGCGGGAVGKVHLVEVLVGGFLELLFPVGAGGMAGDGRRHTSSHGKQRENWFHFASLV